MFTVELQRYGNILWKGNCESEEAKLHGVYALINGKEKCFLPDSETLREALPYHYRKAFDRAALWWTQEYSDVIKMNLFDYRGFPMGTLFAKWQS